MHSSLHAMDDSRQFDVDALLADRDWLRALARELVGASRADDLIQQTWLAALSGRSRPRGGQRAWLGSIMRYLSYRRRRWPEELVADPAVEHGGAAELLVRAEQQERLIAAVRALREPYRSTVLLRYFEGVSIEALSERMGVPSSTSRTRLQRALAELRERIGDDAALHGIALGLGLGPLIHKGAWMASTTKVAIALCAVAALGGAGWYASRSDDAREEEARAIAVPEPAPLRDAVDPNAVADVDASRDRAAALPEDVALVESSPAIVTKEELSGLELVVPSFLTVEPDVAGLLDACGRLAAKARVVEESIVRNPETGVVTGKLELEGDLTGTFAIGASGYRVDVMAPAESPHLAKAAYFGFEDQFGRASHASATVQHHPNTNRHAANAIGDREQIVGWSLGVDPALGTHASPITMQAQGSGWRIGQSDSFEARDYAWIANTSSFDAWLALLKPHVSK